VRFSFPGGESVAETKTITLASNTAATVDVTVPADELWLLWSAHIHNGDDVSRACAIVVRSDWTGVDYPFMDLMSLTLSAGAYGHFPNGSGGASNPNVTPILLFSGDMLRFSWAAGGLSTGGTARYGYKVQKVRI